MKRIYIYLFVLIGLGLTIYSNTLAHNFVWDDKFLIVENYWIKSPIYLPQIFTSELRTFSLMASNYYRPLQSVSYMIDYSIWRLNPFGYHLTNIILHILVSLLVFFLIRLVSKKQDVAFLTSLLFLVHPIHTEVNSYISGRADSLAAIFLLSSFIFYIKHDTTTADRIKKNSYFIFSILAFAFAILSKEAALIFPFILSIYCIAIKKQRGLSMYIKQGVFFVLILLYIILRLTKLNFLKDYSLLFFPSSTPFLLRFFTSAKIVFLYLRLLLLPLNLHLLRSVAVISQIFTVEGILSLMFILILCAGLILAYRYYRVIFFYYAWFLIALLPTLDLFPIGVSVAEHFLYLPSVGFFAIVSTGIINSSFYKKRIFAVLGIIVLLLFPLLTYRQNKIWKNNLSLYTYLLKYAPDNYVVHNNLGVEYLSRGLYDKAEQELRAALKINPDFALSYNSLGHLYSLRNLPEEAIKYCKIALTLRPDIPQLHDNLGLAYLSIDKHQDAIREFKLALELNPRYLSSYQHLGMVNYNLGHKEKAIEYYKKAIMLDDKYIPAYYNIGLIFFNDANYQQAYKWWHKAYEISPNDIYIKSALDKLPHTE